MRGKAAGGTEQRWGRKLCHPAAAAAAVSVQPASPVVVRQQAASTSGGQLPHPTQPTFQLMPCPGMYSLQSAPYCRSGSSTPSSG